MMPDSNVVNSLTKAILMAIYDKKDSKIWMAMQKAYPNRQAINIGVTRSADNQNSVCFEATVEGGKRMSVDIPLNEFNLRVKPQLACLPCAGDFFTVPADLTDLFDVQRPKRRLG